MKAYRYQCVLGIVLALLIFQIRQNSFSFENSSWHLKHGDNQLNNQECQLFELKTNQTSVNLENAFLESIIGGYFDEGSLSILKKTIDRWNIFKHQNPFASLALIFILDTLAMMFILLFWEVNSCVGIPAFVLGQSLMFGFLSDEVLLLLFALNL